MVDLYICILMFHTRQHLYIDIHCVNSLSISIVLTLVLSTIYAQICC